VDLQAHANTHTYIYIYIYTYIYIYRHTDINTYILLCPVQNVHVYTYIHIINIIFAYFCMNANPKYFEAAASGTFFASEVAGINSCRLAVLSVISCHQTIPEEEPAQYAHALLPDLESYLQEPERDQTNLAVSMKPHAWG
jgi:hypothetical protein